LKRKERTVMVCVGTLFGTGLHTICPGTLCATCSFKKRPKYRIKLQKDMFGVQIMARCIDLRAVATVKQLILEKEWQRYEDNLDKVATELRRLIYERR
jgi:peroxiredoxin